MILALTLPVMSAYRWSAGAGGGALDPIDDTTATGKLIRTVSTRLTTVTTGLAGLGVLLDRLGGR